MSTRTKEDQPGCLLPMGRRFFDLQSPKTEFDQEISKIAVPFYEKLPSSQVVARVFKKSSNAPHGLGPVLRELGIHAIDLISDLAISKLSELSLSKKLPPSDEVMDRYIQELITYIARCLAQEAWITEAIIVPSEEANVGESKLDNPVSAAERGSFSLEYFFSKTSSVIGLIAWISAMSNPDYWLGEPPFYIFISGEDLPSYLPRIYRYDLEGHETTWASGFGGRLIVLNRSGMTKEEKDEMWSQLLVNRNLYGGEYSIQNRRNSVFGTITDRIQPESRVIDVAGGTGDFINFAQKVRPDCTFTLIDNATLAVEVAVQMNINAHHHDVEQPFPTELKGFDVATIIYSVQWLTPSALLNVYSCLRPGGTLMCNIYPPGDHETETYQSMLIDTGFQDVSVIMDSNGFDPIIVAKKPEKI